MDRPKHTVHFADTPENWSKWGRLVDGWVFGTITRPGNVGVLEDQMLDRPNGVYVMTGVELVGIPAPASPQQRRRPVNIRPYDNTGGRPIDINIPHEDMARADQTWLASLGSSPYPLASFYSAMFSGAPLTFSSDELEEMRRRRVGEYVINECM
jgi:hypothetical protein